MRQVGWSRVRTLESFINREQRLHPTSRGVFSDLMRRIGVASKVIHSKVQKAGLLSDTGTEDRDESERRGETRFHLTADQIMKAALRWFPSIAALASREEDELIPTAPRNQPEDLYVVLFDALDGSTNIDVNVSVGTIFSIYRWGLGLEPPTIENVLQPGYKQVAAGYVIYGSSTMFVFTTGQGVHGFTLDPEIGEFVLSHENILLPNSCRHFSANDGHYQRWDEPTRRFADHVRFGDVPRYGKTTSRYIGSLVADFHRNLLHGGVFLYPANNRTGTCKLQLALECNPLAMVVEQAGGLASTGRERILDIHPQSLHQTVPLAIGNRQEVELYERMVREHDIATGRVRATVPPSPPAR
jgi:fructose-1,6-bisphosphatase I